MHPPPSFGAASPAAFASVSRLGLKRDKICSRMSHTMQLIKQLSGPGAAGVGVLGLSISGTVWNFYGVQFGLSGTLASLLALSVGLFLLRPLPLEPEATTEAIAQPDEATTTELAVGGDASSEMSEPASVLTTAEAIALKLAEEAEQQPATLLANYAPEHLLAGKNLPSRKRQPGPSLQRYRTMTSELFKS